MAVSWNNITRNQILVGLAVILVLYVSFIWGLSTNPPGFYVDESCLAYNGYLVAHTGRGETGARFPLYFQCYTDDEVQFANPTHVYLLAAMYLFVPPSNLSARVLAATMVFIAMLLLGVLAAQIAKRSIVGVIVALTAMATPWFFEVSRLVLETFFYPFCIVLFLFCLYNAYQRERCKLIDNISLAVTLALITYSYSIGRLLGPALALGLLFFASNKRALLGVMRTWVIYAITLIPFIYVYLTNPDAITRRLHAVSYFTQGKPWWDVVKQFVSGFFQDLSPGFLLFSGDPVGRHHVPVMGEIFAATFILAIVGLVLVILRHRGDAWWRFVLFGLVLSVLPGAITNDRHHSLRLLGFPIFLMILTVPALSWLIVEVKERSSIPQNYRWLVPNAFAGRMILSALLIFTLAQAVFFQIEFWSWIPQRHSPFHAAYPDVLKKALAEPDRPIYLKDGTFGPSYIHAFWYATMWGIDLSNFHHLAPFEIPPANSLVIASEPKCSNCDVLLQKDFYLLYRTVPEGDYTAANSGSFNGDIRLSVAATVGATGTEPGKFSKPRGIACDHSGNFYVADTGNSRVEKFDPDGKYSASFGTVGTGEGEMRSPDGIAIDESNNIYVTDSANHKLLKLGPDGQFLKEWSGTPLGFYGPRDMAFGPNKQLYIIDQGRNRIVRFDPESEAFLSWGGPGTAEGQFSEPTGIGIGNDLVFVSEPINHRIQVFDLEGNFVRQWRVDAWDDSIEQYPDVVFDPRSKRLFITNSSNKDILIFDVEGNPKGRIKPVGAVNLGNPSRLCILEYSGSKFLAVLDSGDYNVSLFNIGDATK